MGLPTPCLPCERPNIGRKPPKGDFLLGASVSMRAFRCPPRASAFAGSDPKRVETKTEALHAEMPVAVPNKMGASR